MKRKLQGGLRANDKTDLYACEESADQREGKRRKKRFTAKEESVIFCWGGGGDWFLGVLVVFFWVFFCVALTRAGFFQQGQEKTD